MVRPPDGAKDWNESLSVAAANGKLEGVEKALENKADINHVRQHWTALKLASVYGHLKIVKYLIEKSANPHLPYDGKSPLEAALGSKVYEHTDVIDYLVVVMKLPEILDRIEENGYTPLGFCVKYKYHKKAQQLLDLGANVCKTDRHGNKPLVYAVEINSIEMVKKLLEKGAGASCVSALKCALDLTSNEIAQCLLEYKPDIANANLIDGFTPLTKALHNCNLEMAKYLIQSGADPTKQDRNGNFPLDKALEKNSVEIAEILFSKKDNVKFPLEISPKLVKKFAENGRLDVYRFLIKNYWNMEQCDENGNTSLALSAAHQHFLLTEFLIENGADITKATEEIEKFRKIDRDFDHFMEVRVLTNNIKEKCRLTGTGQECAILSSKKNNKF